MASSRRFFVQSSNNFNRFECRDKERRGLENATQYLGADATNIPDNGYDAVLGI
jgi:hypothetical protein